jgi:hypothetical protein
MVELTYVLARVKIADTGNHMSVTYKAHVLEKAEDTTRISVPALGISGIWVDNWYLREEPIQLISTVYR